MSTHFKSFIRGLSIFYFHLLIKLTFLVSKGLYEISPLVLDAVPIVSYRVKHSKRNSISTRPYVLFSISLMSGSQNPIIEELGGDTWFLLIRILQSLVALCQPIKDTLLKSERCIF